MGADVGQPGAHADTVLEPAGAKERRPRSLPLSLCPPPASRLEILSSLFAGGTLRRTVRLIEMPTRKGAGRRSSNVRVRSTSIPVEYLIKMLPNQ
uniref:Uncharacterized protein n=1 Tax=Trichuris muris TaxID=70415 RepID=A0A5S6QYM1_TRIMR